MNKNKIIVIMGVICLAVGLIFMSRPKHKTVNLSNLSSKELKQKPEPVPQAAAPTETTPSDDDGIISFEMYPNPNKAVSSTNQGNSREASVRFVLEAVSGIEDDLTAKNAVVNQISRLNFKLTGAELLSVLEQAAIGDEFYYASAVKSVATSLQYPLTVQEFEAIVSKVTDMAYQFKLRNTLRREQERQSQL